MTVPSWRHDGVMSCNVASYSDSEKTCFISVMILNSPALVSTTTKIVQVYEVLLFIYRFIETSMLMVKMNRSQTSDFQEHKSKEPENGSSRKFVITGE